MRRRQSIKTIAISAIGTGTWLSGCRQADEKDTVEAPVGEQPLTGRTAAESARDKQIMAQQFFTAAEINTITILSDWIIPADDKSGSASEAGVPSFIAFMVNDQPGLQTPLRGGLRWLDMKCASMFGTAFAVCSRDQQKTVLELIAYPEESLVENRQGAAFFSQLRDLVAMGFFSSRIGIEDIGYMGNTPNVWDGVPEEVLRQHGLSYDEQTLKECLKPEDRSKIMEWPAD